MVEKHPESATRARFELGHGGGEIISTVEGLHHHRQFAQLVTPDVLKELGVMATLHPDPVRSRHLGATRR
jgi:hypothetical protein